MLFVCHPKFCIWYVMVFLEWLIVPQVEQPPAAVTCSITAGEFKSFTRTTLGQFRYFLVLLCSFFVFPFCPLPPLRFQFFYLVLVHAFMLGFASFFFSSFVYYAITVCFLTCCLHALLVVLISACYVIFTCRLHIVALFFRLPFDFLSLVISLFYLS